MSAEDVVLDYYEAVRRGEPLYPYFRESASTWKAAISTTYDGYDSIAEGLREQSRTTTDWTVDSHALETVDRDGCVTMTDHVTLAWTSVGSTDTESEPAANHGGEGEPARTAHEHETRWSGVLVEHADEWLFTQLHVSTASSV